MAKKQRYRRKIKCLKHLWLIGWFETKNPRDEQIEKYKRHGSELITGEKFMYTHENIMPVIMHFRVSTTKAIEFRSKLGFKQHDIMLIKEQSVISKLMKTFLNEKILP